MYKHLLVPLDGSHLAEAILPPTAYFARQFKARVTLFHVIEHRAPQEIHGERHLSEEIEAEAYLEEIAQRTFSSEVQVEWHVHTSEVSDVARSIVDHGEELDADMIALCTHGRGGLRSWLFGSIAQQVLSLGTNPVLLVHPSRTRAKSEFSCSRLVFPLDGNPEHEQGLPTAMEIARVCDAALHLVMVVHTFRTLPGERAATATLLPAATSAVLDLKEQGAEQYLRQIEKKLGNSIQTVTTEVQRGDPAKSIVKAAREVQANLIVIGTHAKSSMDAFWSGSITPRIASRAPAPLLLVPVQEEDEN